MRRKIGCTVVAIAMLAFIGACGGGGGTTTQTTGTAQAKAITTANNVAAFGMQTMFSIWGSLGGGAQVIKETPPPTCTGNYDSVQCTLNDGQGGSCTITGYFANMSSQTFSATLNMDCNNYHPSSDVTADGDMKVELTVNSAAFEAPAMVFKGLKATGSDQCNIQEGVTDPEGCIVTNAQCTAESANFMMSEIISTTNGFTVTDVCGIHSFSPGFTMTAHLCGTQAGSQFTLSWTFSGQVTEDGQAITLPTGGSWSCNIQM